MSKLFTFFTLVLFTTSTYAIPSVENELIKTAENSISIEVKAVGENLKFEFNFDNSDELLNFDIESALVDLDALTYASTECTASITVEVSVGVDSTYAKASVTVEGIPCDKIVEKAKELQKELKKALT